ncbi:MAG: DUF975 family protein [Lachnospiraceae bacterium]|nr:DUF975 family protein [Lachnospiraceae bacterium]
MEHAPYTPGEKRRAWKKKARGVVRAHYLLLVIVCLVSVFYGTEFGFVRESAQGLYDSLTGRITEIGGEVLKVDMDSARDKVLMELVQDNIEAGREKAASQLLEYQESKEDPGAVIGRRRGVFATIANEITSGHLYMILFSGLHGLFHSSRLSSAIVVFGNLLLAVLAWVFLKNMYQAVLRRIFLEARLYPEVPVSHVLHIRLVGRWIRASLTLLLRSIYEVLWSLTVVGFFIKHYSYILVPFIVAENPDIRPNRAITLSRRMMNGHKWECAKLELSFLGWLILGSLTFGIVNGAWTVPYLTAALAEFYADRRAEAKAAGVPGAELLNDAFLYEKAEEAFLRRTYQDVEEQKHFIDENRVTLTGVRGFLVKYFGLWIGSSEEKRRWDEVDRRRQQIVEDRAVIKGKIYPQRLTPLWNPKNNNVVRDIRYIRTYSIWSVVLVFFVFCFIGWCWEVGLHLFTEGTFVNRGFLHGPWLPIYGGGVVMILLLLARFRHDLVKEALAIVVLCGAVEYTTSLVMERAVGMRWWDYTGYFLNLHGRICGEGLLVFALGGMAAVYLLVPLLDTMWSRANPRALAIVAIVLLAVFAADLVWSFRKPNVGEGITSSAEREEIRAGQWERPAQREIAAKIFTVSAQGFRPAQQ